MSVWHVQTRARLHFPGLPVRIDSRFRVQTIERTVEILNIIHDAPTGLTQGHLSSRLGLPKTAACGRRVTLTKHGSVRKKDDLTEIYRFRPPAVGPYCRFIEPMGFPFYCTTLRRVQPDKAGEQAATLTGISNMRLIAACSSVTLMTVSEGLTDSKGRKGPITVA